MATATAGESKQLAPRVLARLKQIAKDEGFVAPSFKVEDGSKSGDGYMGVLLRVIIAEQEADVQKAAISLVIKSLPPVAVANQMFGIDLAFKNETLFYQRIQPAFINFQRERGLSLKECAPTAPRCFDASGSIILEDMRPRGFVMKPGNYLMDLEHCSMFLGELGRLHAVSFAIKDQQPQLFPDLVRDIQEAFISRRASRDMRVRFDAAMVMAMEELKKRDTLKDKARYLDILERYSVGYYEKLVDLLEPSLAEPYTVLNHGDTWSNNALFTYERGGDRTAAPTGICLIDYQILRATSPAIDVSYVIFMCTTKALRDQHYQHLLDAYYDSVATFTKKLGTDPQKVFPRSAFEDQLKKFSKFSLGLVVHETPVFSYVPAVPAPTQPDWGHSWDTEFEPAFNLSHGDHDTCWARIIDVIVDLVDMGYVE